MASKPSSRPILTYVRPTAASTLPLNPPFASRTLQQINTNTNTFADARPVTLPLSSVSLSPSPVAPTIDPDQPSASADDEAQLPILHYSEDDGFEPVAAETKPCCRSSPLFLCACFIFFVLFSLSVVFALTRLSDLSFLKPLLQEPEPTHTPCPPLFAPTVTAPSTAFVNCDSCYHLPRPTKPPLPPSYYGDRYVKFDVKGQLNNHREALVIALIIARLTNRTLIVGYRAGHLREVFDFYSLSQFHPVIAEEHMPYNYFNASAGHWAYVGIGNRAPDAQVWYLSQKDFELHPNQSQWIQHNTLHSLTNNHFFPFFLQDEFGQNSTNWDAQILHYTLGWGYTRSFFSGFPIALFEGMMSWVMNVLLPSSNMLEYSNRVLAHLPSNFIAIHWRLGDFLGNPARAVFIPKVDQVLKYLVEECGVKPDENRVVYIATDSPNEEIVRNFTAIAKQTLNLQVVTWADYAHLFSTVWDEADTSLSKASWKIGFIESLILGRSARLVPTPLSSFSEFAFMLMRAYGNQEGGAIAERFWTIHTRLPQTALSSPLRPLEYKEDVPMTDEAQKILETFLKPLQ